MKFKKGCNRTCLVQAAQFQLWVIDILGSIWRGRGGKERKEVSQIMALGMRDKASRLRSNKISPTTEIAKPDKTGLLSGGTGKVPLLLLYFSPVSHKKTSRKERVEKQEQEGEKI